MFVATFVGAFFLTGSVFKERSHIQVESAAVAFSYYIVHLLPLIVHVHLKTLNRLEGQAETNPKFGKRRGNYPLSSPNNTVDRNPPLFTFYC